MPLDERARLRRKRQFREVRPAAAVYCSPQRHPLSSTNLSWITGCPLESEGEDMPGTRDDGPALLTSSLVREDLTAAAAALDALDALDKRVDKEAEDYDGCM